MSDPVEVPKDPPRFTLNHGGGYTAVAGMDYDTEGDWVRYEAYVADVTALRKEIARLEDVIIDARSEAEDRDY